MDNKLWQPKAIALHTAFKAQDKDYNWYIHGGEPLVLEKEMKAAHYALIRDRKGDAPRILVIAQTERIGLLIGTMRTERRDYVNGTIYDTLYLEFDSKDRHDVLSSVATLLAAYDQDKDHQEYQQYEKFFLNYAETLAEKGENAQIPTPPLIDLPMYVDIPVENCEFRFSEVAVFSETESRKKCARYLKWLSKQEKLVMSARVISTGRIGKEELQKYANTHTKGDLIILTLSDSVQGEEDLRQRFEGLSETAGQMFDFVKKHIGGKSVGTLILALCSIFWFATLDRTPPQLTSMMLQFPDNPTINLMEQVIKPLPRLNKPGELHVTFSEAVQGVSLLKQSCKPADTQGKIWDCPVAVPSADPNQSETFTLTIEDVKDQAENSMEPAKRDVMLESADIQARLVNFNRYFPPDTPSSASMTVEATAKYGIAEVRIQDMPATQQADSAHWQVEMPLLQVKKPLRIFVKDTYGNTLEERYETNESQNHENIKHL